MKKPKKYAAVLAAAVLLAVASVWLYGRTYSVRADSGNLPQAAEAWLSRGADHIKYTVELREALDLGGQRFVLAELGDGVDLSLCLLRLERGLNGRYKIAGASWGGGSMKTRLVQERDCFYVLLGGRNHTLPLRAASLAVEDKDGRRLDCRMEIPEEEYFLTAAEAGPDFQPADLVAGSLRLYDGEGRDVTERMAR